MQSSKLLLFVGLSLVVGFIWGQVFTPELPYLDTGYEETKAVLSLDDVDEIATIDVIREGDDIYVVDHDTGRLIFEYNRFKEADKEAWEEYAGLLKEV